MLTTRRDVIAAAIAATAGHSLAAVARTPARAAPPVITPNTSDPTNAALVYYPAWEMTMMWDKGVSGVFSTYQTNPAWLPGPEYRHWLIENDSLLELYEYAASIDGCDWGTIASRGRDALLFYSGKLTGTARVFDADARRLIANGDGDAASRRIVSIIGFSRHVAAEPSVISNSCRQRMLVFAADRVRDLAAKGLLTSDGAKLIRARLDATIDASDPLGYRTALDGDRAMLLMSVERAREEARTGAPGKLWRMSNETCAALVPVVKPMDEAALSAAIDGLNRFYSEAAALVCTDGVSSRLLEDRARDGAFGPFAEFAHLQIDRLQQSRMEGEQMLREMGKELELAR